MKRVKYKIQEKGPGTIFGHEEMLLGIPRETTIRALEEVEVLYLNQEEFFKQMEYGDIEQLKKTIRPLDVEDIARRILNIRALTNRRVRKAKIIFIE